MVCLLHSYQEEVFRNWTLSADKKTSEGLNRPLLVREPGQGTLKVNFGTDLLSILNEVKHLQRDFPAREIPAGAADIFKSFNDFRCYNNSLEQTVGLYNYLKLNTTQEEFDLIRQEVGELDERLQHAEETLTWNSPNIWNYVESLRNSVRDLVNRVKKAQENVLLIKKEISAWEKIPLFQRISKPKEESLLDLASQEATKTARYSELEAASCKVQQILEDNSRLYRANVASDQCKVQLLCKLH